MKDLHIVLIGPPGTGKSRVIQLIKELLEKEGVKTESVFGKFNEYIVCSYHCLKLTVEEPAKTVTRI